MTVVTQAMAVTGAMEAQLMAAVAASMGKVKITKLVVKAALEAPLMAALEAPLMAALEAPLMAALEAKVDMLVRQTAALAVTAV